MRFLFLEIVAASCIVGLAVIPGCESSGSAASGGTQAPGPQQGEDQTAQLPASTKTFPDTEQAAPKATPTNLAGRRQLEGGMVVNVRGLRVVAPLPDGDKMKMRAFNWNAGTTVAVGIAYPPGGIIGMDRDTSKIVAFTDDHGTDLWTGPQASEFSNSQIDFMPSIADNGKSIVFDVDAQAVPASGATALSLEGEVVWLVAGEKETSTAEDVALESGTKFTCAGRAIEIVKTGSPSFGAENAFSVTLRFKGGVSDIQRIAFLDAEGAELTSRRQGSYWSGRGEDRIDNLEYVFESKPKGSVKVALTRWTDLKQETVPLDLSFGVGL